jgi:hypothetical protein
MNYSKNYKVLSKSFVIDLRTNKKVPTYFCKEKNCYYCFLTNNVNMKKFYICPKDSTYLY